MRRLRLAAVAALVAVLAVFTMGAKSCQHQTASTADNTTCAKILRENPQLVSCKEVHG